MNHNIFVFNFDDGWQMGVGKFRDGTPTAMYCPYHSENITICGYRFPFFDYNKETKQLQLCKGTYE